jgi:VCBS repeat-containing protein
VNADGTYTYTPNADYFGPDSFTYRVNDGSLDSNVATVSITVASGGLPTNIVPGAQAINEDAIRVFSGASAPRVADSDSPTLTVTLSVSNGTVSLGSTSGLTFTSGDGNADATVTFSGSVADINAALDGLAYAPAADYNGPATLTISSTDGTSTDVDTVSISVNPVNDGPVASSTAATVSEDGMLAGVLPAATDADLDSLTYSVASGPSNGALGLNADGTYTYTPAANFSGVDSFTYEVFDGSAFSAPATVTITVAPVNDAPSVSSLAVAVNEDSALNGTLPAATDADLDALTYSAVTGPANGTLVLNADGTYRYTPAANWSGTDSFTFKVNDGAVDSATATVTITVVAVNDAPTVVVPMPDQSVTPADAFSFAVPAGVFLDAESIPVLSATLADGSPLPAWLGFDALTGTFSGTAPAGFGALSVRITASDGALSASSTFTLTEQPVPAPAPRIVLPVFQADAPRPLSQPGAVPAAMPGATAPQGPVFPDLALGQPVDTTVAASNLGAGGDAAGSGPVQAPFDLNALLPTAPGAADRIAFPVIRVSALEAASFVATRDGAPLTFGGHRLFVFHGIPNAQLTRDGFGSVQVPEDAFAHTDPAAVVRLEARLADGSPLPAWLTFDRMRGTFRGVPPADARGSLEIEVIARDDQGREARTRFEMLVDDLRAEELQRLAAMPDLVLGLDVDGKEKEKARLKAEAEKARSEGKGRPEHPAPAGAQPAASFTEQMRLAKASRDPLLDRIARATRETPPNRN